MWFRSLVAFACLAPATLLAQPTAVPTFEARIRSVNDLLDRAEYLATLVGQEEAGKQFRGFLTALTSEKEGLEGLDLKRPFGAYAFVKPDVVDSPFVVMIPVASEARFVRMLKDRLEYEGQAQDGVYSYPIPRTNESGYFRFAHGYVHVSLRHASLDPASLLKPEAFFAKDDGSVANAILRIDQLPGEFKQMLLGQVELRLQDSRGKQAATQSPAEKKLQALILDGLLAAFKVTLEEGKELTLRLQIDPRSDDLALEAGLTAKPGTVLAKSMRDAGAAKSLPAAIASSRQATVRLAASASIPSGYLGVYHEAIDSLTQDLLAKTPDESRELAKRLSEALLPALKAGKLDLAAALPGPGGKGFLTAITVKDSRPLVELLKSLTLLVPANVASIAFDRETVGGFTLHRFELKALPDSVAKQFGSRTLWLANSPDHLVLSLEDDASTIKNALKAKPVTSPILDLSVGLTGLVALTETALPPEKIGEIASQVFGPEAIANRDVVRLTIMGGTSYHARFSLKGKAISFGVSVDQAKKSRP